MAEPIIVRVEAISIYEVEIPEDVFSEPDADLAAYVSDTDNWGSCHPGSSVDGHLGDILLPPRSGRRTWEPITGNYWGERDEAVHGKYGPTSWSILGGTTEGKRYQTASALMRAVLAPEPGDDD